MTQNKTNAILGFTTQLDLLVKPTPTPCLFLIGVVIHQRLEPMWKPTTTKIKATRDYWSHLKSTLIIHIIDVIINIIWELNEPLVRYILRNSIDQRQREHRLKSKLKNIFATRTLCMAIHFCYFWDVGKVRYNGRLFLPNACTSRTISIILVVVVNRDYLLDNARVRFLITIWVVKDTELVRTQTGSSLVWSNCVFWQALFNFNCKWKPRSQDLPQVDKSQICSYVISSQCK